MAPVNLGSATRNILFTYIHEYVWDFKYNGTTGANGSAQTWTVPYTGKYKIEVWGASSTSDGTSPGNIIAGLGGYSAGNLNLNSSVSINIYVGGVGKSGTGGTVPGGWNGGGLALSSSLLVGAGGGATDMRLSTDNSIYGRIIVAGGGGGGNADSTTRYGGYAGGLSGQKGGDGSVVGGGGGTQISGGSSARNVGAFAQGGAGTSNAGGGGGGYYGGGGGATSGDDSAGGGGSSYISGYKGCVAIISASSTSPRKNSSGTTCTESLAASDVSCSYHYSGYIFTDTVMKAGNESMPAPGGGNETGHSGNGYARITFIEP